MKKTALVTLKIRKDTRDLLNKYVEKHNHPSQDMAIKYLLTLVSKRKMVNSGSGGVL